MSTQDDLGDFFSGGEAGAPTISWKYERPPVTWEGILLPSDGVSLDGPAYKTTQQRNIEGELLFWENKDGSRSPRKQAEVTFLTAYTNGEFLSDPAKQRLEDSGEKDDGVRRQFIKGSNKNAGASAKEFRDALTAAGVRVPEVGATVKQTLVKRVDNGDNTSSNHVKWEYAKPTEASLAKVKAYVEANAPADGANDEDPPF